MKRLQIVTAFAIVFIGLFMGGCSTVQLNSSVSPGANMAALKKVYVVHLASDSRALDQVIAERLRAKGFQATNGDAASVPSDVDAIVTYQDKWMWDITMYMIELNVQFRKPVSNIALATGHSFRTSLARKSPPEMVDEVLFDIFKK